MGATWARNETDAAKRACGMLVQKTDGSLAPHDVDLMALGYVKIRGVSAPHFVLAVGTMTNQREPLVIGDDAVEATNVGADTVTLTAHAYKNLDGPVVSSLNLGAVVAGTDVWIIVVDANTIAFATSLTNAQAGTKIDLTADVTGAVISDKATTQRGVDGHFEYIASQPETDHPSPETIVIVNGPAGSGYERSGGGGAYTTVTMASSANDWGSTILEDGITRDEALRAILRTEAAPFREEVGGVITYRDMADTKDSHHGTITSAGRSATGIDDLGP